MVKIRDDGQGFAPEAMAGSQSLGVLGVRERAGRFSGTISLLRRPDRETTVRVRMPET